MTAVLNPIWYILAFTILLCWPSMYRLPLQGSAGNAVFYGVAYLVPLTAGMFVVLKARDSMKRMFLLLACFAIVIASVTFSTERTTNVASVFYGIKFYTTPIMLLWLGHFFGRKIGADKVLQWLSIIVFGHFVFSLLFYFDVLPNPVYSGSGDFNENWTTTVGALRAFLGLTLSKFDLAYQVGFIVVGLVLSNARFRSRFLYWLTLFLGICVVIFTYNKTVYLVFALTVAVCFYRYVSARARWLAIAGVSAIIGCLGYVITLFLRGDLSLVDVAVFLSPQTFWSRVAIWGAVASFSLQNVFTGFGAGYFTRIDETVDNQYLSSYLEMGLLGAATYFTLFAATIQGLLPASKRGRAYFLLLAVTFLIGDMLNALSMIYIIGLFLGLDADQPVSASELTTAHHAPAVKGNSWEARRV